MTEITWDETGKRLFEAGVDHGVLYPADNTGAYPLGVPWNGLTALTESPGGAEANAQYADNIKYLNLISAETFGGTIEAFTYPDEFGQCDGTVEPVPGVALGQQGRRVFGLSYRTKVGNDTEGADFGEKIHLIWGAQAAPSEKNYQTVNDQPEAMGLSWDITTTPVAVSATAEMPNPKPTASMTIDSTKVDADAYAALKEIIYGTPADDARLPLPDEVIALFAAETLTEVNLTDVDNQPTYDAATHVVTLPAVTGIQWKVNGVNKAPGAQPALTVGQTANIEAVATAGHTIEGDNDWSFAF